MSLSQSLLDDKMNMAPKNKNFVLLHDQLSPQSSTEAAWHVIKRQNDEQLPLTMKMEDEEEENKLSRAKQSAEELRPHHLYQGDFGL